MAKLSIQNQLTGGILTGGLARRLQAVNSQQVDKGLVDLNGQPLVAYIAQKLQPYTLLPLLISANRNLIHYKKYGYVVADPEDCVGYQGPLAGILAMLRILTTDWLMVLPVDSPFLPSSLTTDLWQAHVNLPEKRAFFVQHDRTYPLCLLVHVSCVASLSAYLQSGQRRVQSWLAEQNAVAVDLRHYPASTFFNINEPADLAQARVLALSKNPSA